MTYSDYLNGFIQDFLRVLGWIKLNLFPLQTMFSDYLIFTLIGFGFFMLIIEEVVGIITSFRFGGFIFRHFRVLSPRSYQVPDTYPDYTKEKRVRPYRPFYKASYRQKYTGKYFINYNGRYYPVNVPRYNPFAIHKFNADYKAGKIVTFGSSYDHTYKGSMFKGAGRGLGKGFFKNLLSGKYDGFLHNGNSDYDLDSLDENYSGDSGLSFADELPKSNSDLNFESLSENESKDSNLDIYYDEDD